MNIQKKSEFLDNKEFEEVFFSHLKQIISDKDYKNNFVLKGGLVNQKKGEIIKFCKIIKNEIEIDIKILEYFFFDDDHNEGFIDIIIFILQSQKNGKILVCCWDNRIYIYSKTNINLYLYE